MEAENTAAPAESEAAPVEETIAPEDNPADIYAAMFAEENGEPAPAKDEKPKEEPSAEAAPAAETVEEPVAEEQPKPKEEPKREELALAKVERDLRHANETLATEKKARATAEQKLSALETKLKSNWIKAAEEATGKPFHELMELAAKGEFDEKPQPKFELPDDVKETLEWAKEERRQRAEKAAADAREATKNKSAPVIKAFLDGVTDDYPLVTSMPNAHQAILDIAFEELEKTGRQPDLHSIAEDIEKEARAQFDAYFGNDKLLAALLKDPKRRAAVQALVAPAAPAAPAGKTPAAAAPASGRLAAPAEVVARTAKAEIEDEAAERAAHLKALRSHQERAN
ncbi:MAG TPA: hypothetical protein VGK73_31385 [Polyangiaceae bacterium]